MVNGNFRLIMTIRASARPFHKFPSEQPPPAGIERDYGVHECGAVADGDYRNQFFMKPMDYEKKPGLRWVSPGKYS